MTDWSKPQEVSDLDITFGVRALELMPPRSEIPEEFTRWPGTTWNELQRDWFFRGLSDVTWEAREGIDMRTAKRHLAAIQSSWEPKHEHKEAGVAYLASLWFVRVTAADKVYGEQVAA